MKIFITAEEYFAAYADHPALTDEIRVNADALLEKLNAQMEEMEDDGVVFERNSHAGTEHFGTFISGQGNGGWRPPECPIGAPKSRHKQGKACDVKDANGQADAYLDAHPGMLAARGMAREAPGATVGWCHMQDGLPPSGRETFNP
jgi:hypothetical protein